MLNDVAGSHAASGNLMQGRASFSKSAESPGANSTLVLFPDQIAQEQRGCTGYRDAALHFKPEQILWPRRWAALTAYHRAS